MKILVGSWFQLPRLGTEAFSSLMKAGVKYEKGMGFMFTSDTDIQSAGRAIARATGEPTDLSLRCFVCGQESCPDCGYASICDRRIVSPMCLCQEHATDPDAFSTYAKTFAALLSD